MTSSSAIGLVSEASARSFPCPAGRRGTGGVGYGRAARWWRACSLVTLAQAGPWAKYRVPCDILVVNKPRRQDPWRLMTLCYAV